MNINFFTPRFFPAIAGGEFYILKLALILKKIIGDNPSITCSSSIDFQGLTSPKGLSLPPKDPIYNKYKELDIQRLKPQYYKMENRTTQLKQLEELDVLCKLAGINLTLNTLKILLENGPNLTPQINNYIKNKDRLEYEIFHSTYLPYMSLLYSLILARYAKKVALCTPFFHIFNPRYDNVSYLELLKLFDGVIACTEAERGFLIQKGLDPKNIIVIPMGVDYQLYSNPVKSKTGKPKSFKHEFKIENSFVLFCGNKNYEKGALSLLNAAELVLKKYKDLSFVFIGPTTNAFDSELKKIRKAIDNPKKIVNIVPDNMTGYDDWRKISAFQECILYAMPSRSDAYGMTYLEAWASGKPVIAAGNSVMEEVIKNRTDGLLVEFDNKESISEAVLELISDQEKSQRMGTAGQKKVQINNSWEKIGEKTRKFYESRIKLNQNNS